MQRHTEEPLVYHFFFPSDASVSLSGDTEGERRTLDYIHGNPVQGKWSLVNDFVEYPYSSARFYELGEISEIAVEDFHLIG